MEFQSRECQEEACHEKRTASGAELSQTGMAEPCQTGERAGMAEPCQTGGRTGVAEPCQTGGRTGGAERSQTEGRGIGRNPELAENLTGGAGPIKSDSMLTGAIRRREHRLADGSILPLLTFPLLENAGFVKHCFTTREGGVSEGVYASLNLSFNRGDKKEAVEENFRRVAYAMDAECCSFVFSDQTHTANVRVVTEKDMGHGLVRAKDFFDTDGLVTNVPGLVLSTFYADCVPLYFADQKHRAVGLSHSGWRGTVGRIGRVTVEKMQTEYGVRPEELYCAIGPSICRDCYEVSGDVAERFYREFPGHEEEILVDNGNGKFQLDLWRANEIVLMEAGVQREHITTAGLCTCCHPRLLFSHRASHGKRGNLGAFIAIQEEKE